MRMRRGGPGAADSRTESSSGPAGALRSSRRLTGDAAARSACSRSAASSSPRRVNSSSPRGSEPRPSIRRAAGLAAARGARLAAAAFWTSVFAPHLALFLSSHRAEAPDAVRLLLCHNLADHEAGPLRHALARAALRRADVLAVQNAGDLATARQEVPGLTACQMKHQKVRERQKRRLRQQELINKMTTMSQFAHQVVSRLNNPLAAILNQIGCVLMEEESGGEENGQG